MILRPEAKVADGALPACRAYSLLELLIVCSMLGVLLSLAVPSYQQYLVRSHRSAVIEKLLAASACQQRVYARDFIYDTNRCLPQDVGDYYTLRFEPVADAASESFVVFAEPVNSQSRDVCGALSLDESGRQEISGPDDWLRRCWEGR